MKRKIFLVSFVVILVVASIVGGVLTAQAAPSGGKTLPVQRLFGGGYDGMTGMPTAPNVPPRASPLYMISTSFSFVNPDLTYSKTIDKILITCQLDQWEYQVTLSQEMMTLSPKEGSGTDFRMLGIDHSQWAQSYLIEIYWSGQGEPLQGFVYQTSYLIEEIEGTWTVLDFGPIQTQIPMVLLSP